MNNTQTATPTWLIISSDGDIDYTDVYIAEGATTEQEALTLLDNILGENYEENGDITYRVTTLGTLEAFKTHIEKYGP